jgi:hypothetical protein
MKKQEGNTMKLVIRRFVPSFLLMLVVLVASASAYGATVDLSTLLANPGFEVGNQPINPGDSVGCPASWICWSGSPTPGTTSYVVTTAQYKAGPTDGLAAGLIVPGGTRAASCPTPVEGSCYLVQTGLGSYVAGNTYTLNLWVGTPLTLPADNVTPVGPVVGALRLYWLGNGGGQLGAVDFTPPAPGQWKLVPFSFTPTGMQIGQSIGIGLFVVSGGNNLIVNFDIAAPCTCTP